MIVVYLNLNQFKWFGLMKLFLTIRLAACEAARGVSPRDGGVGRSTGARDIQPTGLPTAGPGKSVDD